MTFDLTGLPPTPEVDAFVLDAAPDAYAKLVERLLASPHYGERWGRHWLDVVRYADTAGETADFPLPHAWRYRNYVIGAFNADKPYDAFVREQLAGDLLAQQLPAGAPGYAELVTATGYISIARRFGYNPEADHHLTIEDTIDTFGKSLLGLTVGCARCHDHKYDPIPTADFYALFGIFESTRYPYPGAELAKVPKDMVPLVPPGEVERALKPHRDALAVLDAEVAKAAEARSAVEAAVRQGIAQGRATLAAGQFDNGGAEEIKPGPAVAAAPTVTAAGTAASAPSSTEIVANVKVGQMIQLAVLPKGNYGADTTLLEMSVAEVGGQGRAWTLAQDVVPDIHAGNPHADGYGNKAVWCFLDVRGGNDAPPMFLANPLTPAGPSAGVKEWKGAEDTPMVGANPTAAPIAPITATLPPKCFYAHPSPAGGVAVAWVSPIDGTVRVTGRVADADPGGGDGVAWALDHLRGDVGTPLLASRERQAAHDEAIKRRNEHAAAEPKFPMAYAVAEGKPHESPIHRRGDPKSPGPVVPRGFLQVLGGQTVPAESAAKGSGRLELAGWLTDPASPGGALAARVMVNRIWQHHFGRGIVATPNDFGTRGEPPTHPELLEFLARRFVESGWSVKAMHRLILSSRAYQLASFEQSETATADGATVGASGTAPARHFARRRLSAEEIRDSILAVSGDLDRTPGEGHPFPPEPWQFTQHEPFVAVYETDKRSVYLMSQRIKRHPLMALFDGPDTNASTAERLTTTVAPQSLFFMNDPWVHAKSAKMAARLASTAPDDNGRLDMAYRLMFGRTPSPQEREGATAFLVGYRADLEQAGVAPADRDPAAWAAYCRVLMGTNEFLYVD